MLSDPLLLSFERTEPVTGDGERAVLTDVPCTDEVFKDGIEELVVHRPVPEVDGPDFPGNLLPAPVIAAEEAQNCPGKNRFHVVIPDDGSY